MPRAEWPSLLQDGCLSLAAVGPLDREIQDRTASQLGPFYVRLRDELYELALLSREADEGTRKRAMDQLFRRDDVGGLTGLLQGLDDETLRTFAERSLTRVNRGNRPDRAAVALRALCGRVVLRRRLRSEVLDCLADERSGVRLAAGLVLAEDEEGLEPRERRGLIDAYQSLTGDEQRELGTHLDVTRLEEGQQLSPDALLTWALAAPSGEAAGRLDQLLVQWSAAFKSADEAGAAIRVFGRQFAEQTLPRDDIN